MDLFSPKIKKFLILTTPTSKFFLEKNVLYILRKKSTLKKILLFREMELYDFYTLNKTFLYS